jgi:hypothetical protein
MKVTYRTVQDLNEDELDELRESYYYELDDEGEDEILECINDYSDITDEFLFEHYEGVMFSEDDFCCNQ